ncbi:glutamine synthetase family protein [Streptomyces sp. MZ04]|uniref:glutamine synthetase family protein n=1 Tax=Streptomyces sp. MZ04 TaxID=2559236 RepID=UPI00107EA2C1|nr:glutamine synthetase family protein [Streptomyces sp. MZ04]TGB15135.1 glutamine synthetase [Streptomyces sp. MZ04]
MSSRRWWSCFPRSSVGRPDFVTEFRCWNDRQRAAAEQIEAMLGELDFVRVAFCDIHGLARSKTVPADVFRTILHNGMDFSPGPFLFDTGHAVAVGFLDDDPGVGVAEIAGAGDFVLVPDPLTFQLLPHAGPGTAWVLGDEYLRDGTPHPLSVRRVLRQVVERYAAHEFVPVIGLEAEWYLTRRLDSPAGNEGNGFGLQGAAPAVAAVDGGYQFNLDSYYDLLAPVTDPLARMLKSLGLPLRSMEHESGPGQVETTFDPLAALDAADAMVLFRTVAKQFCARRGYHASFMTLPALDGFDPSGWHLHQSVMKAGTRENLFAGGDGGEGLSPEGKGYLDGLLDRARDFCLLSVPTVNGYRRMDPRFSLSPSTANWSQENRSVMVRLIGEGPSLHMENRIGEPCANPYLVMAAQLAAGLDGVLGDERQQSPDERQQSPDERQQSPDERQQSPDERQQPPDERQQPPDGRPRLPGSLREAIEAFRGSEEAARLLGRPLVSCLVKLKESEASRFEEWCAAGSVSPDKVTEWEHREYFEVF